MNNLPLQPLVWSRALTAQSAFHQYLIRKDDEATKRSKSQYAVAYGRINTQQSFDVATGFATIDEAKAWAWNHYNEKMQPYVKPMPTWIDVNERLPDKSGRYMVVHQTIKPVKNKSTPVDIDTYDENEEAWTFFRSGIMQEVTHWMPLPEFSTMQNNKGE